MSTVLTGALRIIVHSAECGPIESVFCHSNATGLLADTVYDDEMLSEVVFADLPLGEYWIAATGHLGECLAEGLVVLAGPETQVELKLQPIEAADESGLSLLVECDSSPLSGETVGLRLLYASGVTRSELVTLDAAGRAELEVPPAIGGLDCRVAFNGSRAHIVPVMQRVEPGRDFKQLVVEIDACAGLGNEIFVRDVDGGALPGVMVRWTGEVDTDVSVVTTGSRGEFRGTSNGVSSRLEAPEVVLAVCGSAGQGSKEYGVGQPARARFQAVWAPQRNELRAETEAVVVELPKRLVETSMFIVCTRSSSGILSSTVFSFESMQSFAFALEPGATLEWVSGMSYPNADWAPPHVSWREERRDGRRIQMRGVESAVGACVVLDASGNGVNDAQVVVDLSRVGLGVWTEDTVLEQGSALFRQQGAGTGEYRTQVFPSFEGLDSVWVASPSRGCARLKPSELRTRGSVALSTTDCIAVKQPNKRGGLFHVFYESGALSVCRWARIYDPGDGWMYVPRRFGEGSVVTVVVAGDGENATLEFQE